MTSVAIRLASLALICSVVGCSTFRDEECPNPHHRWSDEWYEWEAGQPVGARQKHKHGKQWPPFARPVGDEQEFSHRYHAAHYWPWPYNCADRSYIAEVTNRQVANGWIAETTLYDYHFDPETQQLNQSGLLHLRWIMENATDMHRVAWVQAGMSTDQSQVRLASVESEAIMMVGAENVPPIMLRVCSPFGRPASEILQIRSGEIESMPLPRLEYTSPNSSGGGSSS